jgi:hypothetical protein
MRLHSQLYRELPNSSNENGENTRAFFIIRGLGHVMADLSSITNKMASSGVLLCCMGYRLFVYSNV